ncbi:MAG: aspartate kinase [Lachnospiraceae bacterium]|nr:aspartate kinase [Lachnospiraceae bacterium]
MLIVKKYGGSSVATPERVRHVAQQIIEDVEAGHRIVVVLSAQGKTTDQLLARAREMNPNPSRRELDMLISTGEQQSVALMAMTLQSMGYQAVSLNAFQVPMYTNKVYGSARLERIGTDRLEAELDCGNVVLVTGFQGMNRYEDVTTLGRGGSDTTAVALAAALHADRCQIYTDVEGVYTADPRYVKNARKLPEIGYDEMLELASTGAKVLHNRCVEMAKKYNVEIEVLSSMVKAPGTVVKEDSLVERMMVSGVAADKNVARISVMRIPDRPGKAFSLFNLLSQEDINVDIILQSIGHDGTKDISFTVAEDNADEAVAILQEHLGQLEAAEITCFKDVAKVSLVGAGMVSNSGVATQMFEALYNAHVNIRMISTSEIKISVLIDEEQVEEAVIAIHDQFRLYEKK